MLKSFTLRWSPERQEIRDIEGKMRPVIVLDYEVENSLGQPIIVKEGRIHGTIAIQMGPNRKRRLEETMMACAKDIEKLLVERGLFTLDPTVKTFGLEVTEG